MGKNKESSYKALSYLIDNNVNIPYAVIPDNKNLLKEICIKNNIKIINDSRLYELIEKENPTLQDIDIVISFLFWKRIKKPLISLSKLGCINFHPAPLPDYRGVGGYNFAILDDLNYWGVSAHFVDEKIDTGDIIQVNKFDISKNINIIELEKISQKELYLLFELIISKLMNNEKLNRIKQGEGKYICKKELEKAKEVTINMSKEEIDKKIRAFWFPPYHGAYILIDNKKYTLVDEKILKELVSNNLGGDLIE